MITQLVYWVNGERFEAEIRERHDAVNAYNQKLREWLDPALLEYLGDDLFRLSIVPVDAQSEFRTEITYVELINYNFGVSTYKYLMNTLELSSNDSIALLIENHFTRISKPVMTNLDLHCGGLQVWDRYPKNIIDLYWGTQTVELGLYNGGGSQRRLFSYFGSR